MLALSVSVLLGAASLVAASAQDAQAAHHALHRRANICGVRGYDLGTSAYYYAQNNTISTPAQCGAQCVQDSGCKTYAVGEGACMFYNVAIDSNSRHDGTSPYAFFDRTCVAAQSTAIESVAASTSSTSSSMATSVAISTMVSPSSSASHTSSAATTSGASQTASISTAPLFSSSSTATASTNGTSTASAGSSTRTSGSSSLTAQASLGFAICAYALTQVAIMCL